jgi:hypothetical protein
VENVVGAAARLLDDRKIADAPLVELDLAAQPGEVLFFSGGKIVQNSHGVASPNELIHNIGADESSAARHKIAHPGLLLEESQLTIV